MPDSSNLPSLAPLSPDTHIPTYFLPPLPNFSSLAFLWLFLLIHLHFLFLHLPSSASTYKHLPYSYPFHLPTLIYVYFHERFLETTAKWYALLPAFILSLHPAYFPTFIIILSYPLTYSFPYYLANAIPLFNAYFTCSFRIPFYTRFMSSCISHDPPCHPYSASYTSLSVFPHTPNLRVLLRYHFLQSQLDTLLNIIIPISQRGFLGNTWACMLWNIILQYYK